MNIIIDGSTGPQVNTNKFGSSKHLHVQGYCLYPQLTPGNNCHDNCCHSTDATMFWSVVSQRAVMFQSPWISIWSW